MLRGIMMIFFEGYDNYKKLFTRNNYFNIHGCISRRYYWTCFLFYFVLQLVISILFLDVFSKLAFFLSVVFHLPMIALTVRRLHDSGHSGIWVLWYYILSIVSAITFILGIGFIPFNTDPYTLIMSASGGVVSSLFTCSVVMFCASFVITVIVFIFSLQKTKEVHDENDDKQQAIENKRIINGELSWKNKDAESIEDKSSSKTEDDEDKPL